LVSDELDYELIDFGDGRKLERFGRVVLDRPCAAAEGSPKRNPEAWRMATARYDRESGEAGRWTPSAETWSPWRFDCHALALELVGTDFGHIGFFPEHAVAWKWIGEAIERTGRALGRPIKLLNLFAYTGGATLAAARAGAEVAHVDAAKGTVAWARRNAGLNGLADAPIRWIVEDAGKFAVREARRGARYDAILLDPPTYGHGPSGRAWKIDRDLGPLLSSCAQLRDAARGFVLLTCHTPDYDGDRLADLLIDCGLARDDHALRRGDLSIASTRARALPSGHFAWWADGGR
jgi:23S rRNA (cytosine1962-C5)-methyltransferase